MHTEFFPGAVHATSFTGSGANLTSIPRAAFAAGSANQVLVNDAAGLVSSEAQLAASRGGTGLNTGASTGLAKVSAGTWSVATLADADVNAAAAIQRSKLAAGTAGYVVVNNPSGVMTSEAALAASRGGLGADFSGVGAGPFVVSCSSGTFAASIALSTSATANSAARRDASGDLFAAALHANSAALGAITSSTDLTFTTTNNAVNFGTNAVTFAPTTIAGGHVRILAANLTTPNATPAALFTLTTSSGAHGTAYTIRGTVSLGMDAGDTGSFTFVIKCKNIATVTSAVFVQKSAALDAGIVAADMTATVVGQVLSINAVGTVAAINWAGTIEVVSQEF